MKKYILFTSIIVILSTTACKKIKPHSRDGAPDISESVISQLQVYDKSSKYSKVLVKCVNGKISCSLNKLPLLREESGEVTKDKIASRLVVSHKWMGDRFLETIDLLDDDIKEMLGSVTAIVIDKDIHPAFYTTQTGAIYIDPRYLWLSPSEAKDITQKDDFRSSYGDALKFIPAWRYVKGNKPAMSYSNLSNPQQRTVSDIKLNLARLLYHELSHANDFANKDVVNGVNRDIAIVDALESGKSNRVSTKLYAKYPLTEPILKHLGKVLYMGENATEDDKKLDSEDVGSLFATDSASNMYNYANQYEDMAMLFESAMMKYHYGIEMDIGFVDSNNNARKCDDYIVGWGIRNPIAKSDVAKRVNFVLKHILPNNTNWDHFTQNGLGDSLLLNTNVGWCSSIDTNSSNPRRYKEVDNTTPIPTQDFLPPFR